MQGRVIERSKVLAGLVSIFLLPGFVAYFLISEYKNHKEALETEDRELVYENIFSSIDTMDHLFGHGTTEGSVRWVKDSTGSSISYKLSLVADSLPIFTAADQQIFKDSASQLERRSQIEQHEIKVELLLDSSDNLAKKIHSRSPNKILKQSFEFETDEYKNIKAGDSLLVLGEALDHMQDFGFIQIIHEEDSPRMQLSTPQISTQRVLSSMTPQIIFCIILLLSVWSAFYMIIKSLTQERNLAEMRNDFMSNMSHELKTPVSTIGVALEAISNFKAGDDPELTKEYLNISRLELDRLSLLVDKALNISLFEQGKFVSNFQELDIKDEIEQIIKTLKISLDNLNVELNYTAEGQNFFIRADKAHMSNVIHNLIENAIKYSKEEISININIKELKDNIRISIADQGIGISEEHQKNIFDKFFRVPTGDIHNIKGHGLGLSYVKEAIDKQGGSIKVISELDKGTEFIIMMPKLVRNV